MKIHVAHLSSQEMNLTGVTVTTHAHQDNSCTGMDLVRQPAHLLYNKQLPVEACSATTHV